MVAGHSKFALLTLLSGAVLVSSCDYYHQKGGIVPGAEPGPIHQSEPVQPLFSSIREKVFKKRCLDCHSPAGQGKNVPLDTLEDLIDSPRELVLPGNSEESGLTIAITRTDSKRMPPPENGAPLSAEEISVIEQWIQSGARP